MSLERLLEIFLRRLIQYHIKNTYQHFNFVFNRSKKMFYRKKGMNVLIIHYNILYTLQPPSQKITRQHSSF